MRIPGPFLRFTVMNKKILCPIVIGIVFEFSLGLVVFCCQFLYVMGQVGECLEPG